MKDGDIYHWTWKKFDKRQARTYHCKSRIALVIDGVAHDTFWMSHGHNRSGHGYGPTPDLDRGAIGVELVDLEYVANLADLEEISPEEARFYNRSQVVDLRHSNNSTAPTFRRKGAMRDPEVMRAWLRDEMSEAVREVARHQRREAKCREWLQQLEAGQTDMHLY